MSAWDDLRHEINTKAIVRGQVTLSSGQEADFYVDLRRITLDGVAAPLVGEVMLDTVDGVEFDAVGGPVTAALPVSDAIMHAAHARGRKLDAFFVRDSKKMHGMGRQVEGPDVAGRRVLVVDDTSTTGGSIISALEALREAGARIVGVAVVADRETGAKEAIEARGFEFHAAFNKADLDLP